MPRVAIAEAIGAMRPETTLSPDDVVHTHFPCSAKAFSIEVFNRRNAPMFEPNGDRVVIDPSESPVPGDMVLAVVDSAPVFGKFTSRRGPTLVVEIEALNPDWSPERIDARRGDRVIGVMTEHARPRRH